VATDVAPHAVAPDASPDAITLRRGVHRRRSLLLLAASAFNLWLWITRIRNLVRDASDFDAAFIAVHAVLYTSAIAVAVVVGVVGWRQFREARRPAKPAA
jgi:hypothetical protein